ncbi:MAG: hypothetical protein ACFBWO_00755 [Paracoccaceae bacterium]
MRDREIDWPRSEERLLRLSDDPALAAAFRRLEDHGTIDQRLIDRLSFHRIKLSDFVVLRRPCPSEGERR